MKFAAVSPAFAHTAAALRDVMLTHAPGMFVAQDNTDGLVLHAPFANPLKPKTPMFFGMVRPGKTYVGYHLMPLYMNKRLTALVTPRLKKRMQGKTCFNFTTVDEALFSDLGILTAQCTRGWEEDLARAVAAYKIKQKK